MIDQRILKGKLFLLKLRKEKELARIHAWEFWKWTKKGRLKNHLLIIDILLEDEYVMLAAIPTEIQEELLNLKP